LVGEPRRARRRLWGWRRPLYAEVDDPRYDLAAARFVARVVLDRRPALPSMQRLLDLVAALPEHPGAEGAVRAMLG
jgi:hypothetical protein